MFWQIYTPNFQTNIQLRRKYTQAEVKALQKCAKNDIKAPKCYEAIPKGMEQYKKDHIIF